MTGGASGIGRAIVATLSAAGARVVSLDVKHGVKPQSSDRVLVEALDVRESSAVDALTASLDGRGLAPDALVNCAGITRDNVVWKLTDEDWQEVIAADLSGPFYVIRSFLAHMMGRCWGRIISISSLAQEGSSGQANYAAAKAGLIGLTKTLAREYGPRGITSNVVTVGYVEP